MTPPSVTGADGRVRTTWWATRGGGGIGRNCYRPSPTPRRGLGDSCLLLFRIGGATMGTASRVSACRRCGGCGAVLGGLCLVFLQQRGARDVLTKVWPYGFNQPTTVGRSSRLLSPLAGKPPSPTVVGPTLTMRSQRPHSPMAPLEAPACAPVPCCRQPMGLQSAFAGRRHVLSGSGCRPSLRFHGYWEDDKQVVSVLAGPCAPTTVLVCALMGATGEEGAW